MLLPLPLQKRCASMYGDRSGQRPVNQTGLCSFRPSVYCFHCMSAREAHRRVFHWSREGWAVKLKKARGHQHWQVGGRCRKQRRETGSTGRQQRALIASDEFFIASSL